jgi:hypothetical protein
MAGFYADVPDHRMALDKDGTQMFKTDKDNNVTMLTSVQVKAVNDEDSHGFMVCGQNDHGTLVVIFPEPRDLAAYFINTGNNGYNPGNLLFVSTSTDTTNGLDGIWTPSTFDWAHYTQPDPPLGSTGPISPQYRSKITTYSVPNITAIRFHFDAHAPSYGAEISLHLYGVTAEGANPNRLALWHPTLDQPIGCADLDWGDVPRASTDNSQVRIKNLSSTLTANTITVSVDALTDTTPSVPAQHTLSIDGGAFGPTCAVETLAPGEISSALTLRRTTSSNAVLSLWAARISAIALSWL